MYIHHYITAYGRRDIVYYSVGDLENATKVHVFKSQKRRQKATRREKVKGRTGEVLNGGIVGHVGCVLALAVSTDDTYLVRHYIQHG